MGGGDREELIDIVSTSPNARFAAPVMDLFINFISESTKGNI